LFNYEEIKRLLKAPYEEKLELANRCIAEVLQQSKKPCVAFSGGKNSLVLLHLVLQQKKDIIVLFNNTTNEFPETVKYVRELGKQWNLNLCEVRPKMTFWQVVEKFGFPHISRYQYGEPRCCVILKKAPAERFYRRNGIDAVFTGISTSESRVRRVHIAHNGMIYKSKTTIRGYPLAFFTDEDTWRYIREHDLPVNPVYEKYKVKRIGCMVCTNYFGWEEELERINPRLYKFVMEKMGRELLTTYI